MTRSRRILLVVAVAVLGIALAAAITWGTSQLVRQRIGLASEPLNAGRRLRPSGTAESYAPTKAARTSTQPATPRTQTATGGPRPPAITKSSREAPATEAPSTTAPAQTSPTVREGAVQESPTGSGDRRDSGATNRPDD